MGRVVRERLAEVPRGATIALTDVTQSLALDIIGDATAGDLERGRVVLRAMVKRFAPAILVSSRLHTRLFPPWRRYADSRADFDAWVDGLIAARRRTGALGDDLLGLFLVTRYEDETPDGAPMSDAEIRDQLVTLLLAGHETSATAIAWAVYFLHRSPETLARLRDELAGLRGSGPEALVKHPYLNAVCSARRSFFPSAAGRGAASALPSRRRRWRSRSARSSRPGTSSSSIATSAPCATTSRWARSAASACASSGRDRSLRRAESLRRRAS